MELLQLRYFLESAINENFSKTSEKYQVPPSSVSIAVKKLESELGCALFTRHKNRVELNEQGMVLRPAPIHKHLNRGDSIPLSPHMGLHLETGPSVGVYDQGC
jgi:hypothetical protein